MTPASAKKQPPTPKKATQKSIHFAVSRYGGDGSVVVVTVNNGPPNQNLDFGFSAHLSTMINGKAKTVKKADGSTTNEWEVQRDGTFYDDIKENGWMIPDMDSEHMNTKAYRRKTLEENQAWTVKSKRDNGNIPINAFFFICLEDVAGDAFNTQVGKLIKCCIRACQRHDSNMAKSYPNWRGNTYSEYEAETDLLFEGAIVPMDRVLLNGNVCDFLIACFGNKDDKISAENLLLYKTLEEEDKTVFSDVEEQGYCYDAIVFCGYPVKANTGTVTIKARLTQSFDVLKGNDTDDANKSKIINGIKEDVIDHITNNIDEGCVAVLKNIVDLGKDATNGKYKQAARILGEAVAGLVSKLEKQKKRKASSSNTQVTQGARAKAARGNTRQVTGN